RVSNRIRRSMRAFVNDTNIGYDDHGIGQPLLFLHAFPLNKSMWSGEMTTLLQEERQFRLVALDWRGFGESDITTGISTMEQCAERQIPTLSAVQTRWHHLEV